jgi:hypothetical protein
VNERDTKTGFGNALGVLRANIRPGHVRSWYRRAASFF